VALGVAIAGMTRRAWRETAIFCLALVPFSVALGWHVIFSVLPQPPVTGPAASSFGWIRIWAYYTSYVGSWKLAVPSLSVFFAMLKNNAGAILRGPGDYFIDPLFAHKISAGPAIAVLVTAAVIAGVMRQMRNQHWKPIFIVLLVYAAVIPFWTFPD